MVPVFVFSTKTAKVVFARSLMFLLAPFCKAQDQSENATASSTQEEGTSTDLFIMLGSDFVRLGLAPKANYDIGIGHTFGFLKKDRIGDELTVFGIPTSVLTPRVLGS